MGKRGFLRQGWDPRRPLLSQKSRPCRISAFLGMGVPAKGRINQIVCEKQRARKSMNLDRYARQIRFAPFGESGQRKLLESRALVCGCGALGSVIANTLVRAGVGHVR